MHLTSADFTGISDRKLDMRWEGCEMEDKAKEEVRKFQNQLENIYEELNKLVININKGNRENFTELNYLSAANDSVMEAWRQLEIAKII
jgi:hypothetical protein